MYAIIRTGGKQYRVQAGDRIRVEKLEGTLGSELVLTDILLVGGDSTHIGSPVVKNAKVTAVVTRQEKGQKVIVFKKKRRKGYRRFAGHRQLYTELFIKAITSPDGATSKSDETAPVVNLTEKREKRAAERAEARDVAMIDAHLEHDVEAAGATPTKKATAKKKVAKKAATGKKKVAKKTAKKGGAKKKAAKKKK